jgi:hypothetical protein
MEGGVLMALKADTLTCQVFDANLRRRGVLPVLGGTAILRNNDVSTFTLDLNGDAALINRLSKDSHLALYDGTQQMCAGTLSKTSRTRSAGATTITVDGSSHMRYLSETITLPDPSKAPDKQDVDAAWKKSGTREGLIIDMVRLNVGQGALTALRRPLQVAASQGRGGNSTLETRFKTPLEEAQTLAKGKLGFRTRLDTTVTPAQPRFEVFTGRDLSRAIRLSEINGALGDFTLEQEAPTVTGALVGGQGEGAARFIRYRTGNKNAWGAYGLAFIDGGQTSDPTELEKSGDDALTDGQEKAAITVDVNDTPVRRFGTHYGLGDTITVELADGIKITDVVQSAEISWDEHGRTVKLTVGPTGDELDAPGGVKKARSLEKQLRTLQTR